MKLTAVVLTFNEEDTIAECLRALTFCEEVLVIDSGSTDKTVKIASQMKADVYYHPFKDFAAARNYGLRKSHSDWVFFVDADERVPDQLKKEIIHEINHPDAPDGFYLKRRDKIFGRWLQYGETNKVRLLRLGRREKGSWERAVHEVWNIPGKTKELKNPLLHYAHESIEEFTKKINFYSTFDAREYFDQGKKVSPWHLLAYPVGKFLKNYFFYQGFRDGGVGFIFAVLMAVNSFLIRAKLFLLWRKK
jgi:glycosyltransferase involved in cell wall biosynthesis